MTTDHTLVFVGGLHRSGTSVIARWLAGHDQVSGLGETGGAEDEGQHVQSLYPTARQLGGPGRFALDPRAHLTEASPLVSPAAARLLFDDWRPYWDTSCPLLLEKSPPNLVRMRFLQALFPTARFLVVVRHPIAVSLATRQRGKRQSLASLLAHWSRAHEIVRGDAAHLSKLLVLRYEDLLDEPDAAAAAVSTFLELAGPLAPLGLDRAVSDRYATAWNDLRRPLHGRLRGALLEHQFQAEADRFGYRLGALDAVEEFDATEWNRAG